MVKSKIAISVDKPLLDLIDSKVDGSIIRSRSQAFEYYLRKGVKESSIQTAVLLIKGSQHNILLNNLNGKSLLANQISFLAQNGIQNLLIVTQHSPDINKVLLETDNAPITIEIIEKDARGNAGALFAMKDRLPDNFVAMSGDIFYQFPLIQMIKKHLEADKLATMGLMTREQTSKFGNAVVDGDLVIDFQEKPKSISSNVVNAGIYIFKPEVFELFDNATSLEKDIFPKIARIKQVVGFFTHGEYKHLG